MKFKLTLILLLLFGFISINAGDNGLKSQGPFKINVFKTNTERFRYYKKLFGKECVSEKITDNRGNGNESFYGTRNMRVILHGVAYRGGANNVYNKNKKRDNQNPLPDEGLKNLCVNGFDCAVYLYGKNFSDAPKEMRAKVNENELHYIKNTLSNEKDVVQMLKMVYENINDKNAGPIYLHCWNGWHQSGLASALILRQFCNVSGNAAAEYWEKNADGAGKGYDHIKARIRNFEPLKEYKIPAEIQKEICPCMK